MEGLLPSQPDDEQIQHLLEEHVRPGMIVAEIGAHTGRFAALMADLVGPDGRVFAVEPHPDLYQLLQHNLAGYGNVTFLNVAALHEDGHVGLWTDSGNTGNNRAYGAGDPEHRVRSVRLQPLVPPLDFALLDTQGTEHLALQGLGSRRPPKCVVEMWPEGLTQAGVTEEQVLQAYVRMGYRVVDLDRPIQGYWNLLLVAEPPDTF